MKQCISSSGQCTYVRTLSQGSFHTCSSGDSWSPRGPEQRNAGGRGRGHGMKS